MTRTEKNKTKLAIHGFEMQQRAENGGYPLANETADALDLGHGTSLFVVSQRSLVEYLHRVASALDDRGEARPRDEYDDVLDDTVTMLAALDTFVFRDGLGERSRISAARSKP